MTPVNAAPDRNEELKNQTPTLGTPAVPFCPSGKSQARGVGSKTIQSTRRGQSVLTFYG